MAWRSFAVLTVAFFIGTSAIGGDAKKDLQMLQGTWQAEKMVAGGMDFPADALKEIVIEFKGDQLNDVKDGKSKPSVIIKLDPTKKPKEINFTPAEGSKGKKAVGIYEIQGDTFKICFAESTRPKDFTSPKGTEVLSAVFKRVKK